MMSKCCNIRINPVANTDMQEIKKYILKDSVEAALKNDNKSNS